MNQSFGGAFLIKIALIFLAIYIVVLGFAMNYAKVFSMKNKIITIIEQNEGYNDTNVALEILSKAKTLSYKGVSDVGDVDTSKCINLINRQYYCISKKSAQNYTYYKVVTYIQFDIPIVTELASGIIPVTGETRYLYKFN